MDSLDEFYLDQEAPRDPRKVLYVLTAVLYTTIIGLSAVTLCMRNKQDIAALPLPTTWRTVGFYDLRCPQTLPKRERTAAVQHQSKLAVLYEKRYSSGARAWRYSIDGYEWFYPTRTAVLHRGVTADGDALFQESSPTE